MHTQSLRAGRKQRPQEESRHSPTHFHLEELEPAALGDNRDVGRACVDAVLQQLLERVGRPVDDLRRDSHHTQECGECTAALNAAPTPSVLPLLSGTFRFALRLRNPACMHRPKNNRKAAAQHQRTYLPRRDAIHSRLVQAADCWRLSCTSHRWLLSPSAIVPAKVVLSNFASLVPLESRHAYACWRHTLAPEIAGSGLS